MICFICHRKASKSLVFKDISYGYCDTHASTVQLGVVKLVSTGKSDYLENATNEYHHGRKSAAEIEFEKQLDMEEFLQDD